jgi:hypothetical protein
VYTRTADTSLYFSQGKQPKFSKCLRGALWRVQCALYRVPPVVPIYICAWRCLIGWKNKVGVLFLHKGERGSANDMPTGSLGPGVHVVMELWHVKIGGGKGRTSTMSKHFVTKLFNLHHPHQLEGGLFKRAQFREGAHTARGNQGRTKGRTE